MSSYTEHDCQNPSCQLLKPHAHIRGGVYFAWQRELDALRASLAASQAEVERLKVERDGLKEELKQECEAYFEMKDERDQAIKARDANLYAWEHSLQKVEMLTELLDQAREELDESRENFKALHLVHGEITDERDEYLRQADKYHGLYKAAESVMGDRTRERDRLRAAVKDIKDAITDDAALVSASQIKDYLNRVLEGKE